MTPHHEPDIPAISRELAAFIADPEPYVIHDEPPLDLRELAAELSLLPVMLDWGGCYGLRADGQVVSFTWEEPRQPRVEHDERIRNLVVYRGSLKYPGLSALVPQRPPTGSTCPDCEGTGRIIRLPPQLSEKVVCYCGGLGWLPGK